MSKKLQLHIADPCHENWENMSPVEQGRFCDACQKQVVDFSLMSDREIVQFFKRPSTGSVCGRFMNDQLDRDMVMEKKRLPWIKYFFQFALPAFLLGKEAQAQRGNDQKPSTVQVSGRRTMGIMVQVNREPAVFVKEAVSGKPIPYASVVVKGDKRKNVADNSGRAFVESDAPWAEGVSITVSCIGYKTKTVTIPSSRQLYMNGLSVELEIDPIVMEEIVIVGTMKSTPKKYTQGYVKSTSHIDKFIHALTGRVMGPVITSTAPPSKTLFKPFAPPKSQPVVLMCTTPDVMVEPVADEPATEKIVPAVKSIPTIATTVYPNPVKRGEALTIELEGKTNEAIMVKLLATDGKTLIIHKQPISKGNNRFTINTDPVWTAGVYFLVFSNEKGILIKTEELLIQ